MRWGRIFGKLRREKPLAYVETRSKPTSDLQHFGRSAWNEAQQRAVEDLQTTAAAIVWGLAIGAGVAFVVWYCMQPIAG